MKVFNQLVIILCIWVIGEYISSFIQGVILIPGSIVGMLLLFLLLQFKVLDLSSIENISGFFLDNMAVFFIPAGVSLIKSLDLIKENVLVLLLVICLSTLVVMYTTGIIVEKMIKKKEEGQKNV
ncbi:MULTISPECIES: CidA/LrgA family protein [unclassified Clostridioides]|uniref:CidA/LrgA family protein n=1 Tax=unclassified Clostridioides TaxID=2635829 RepID=UPI001D113AAC|nr:CidA/LrgA family protein [Clostridioides sp. ZZV14-6150]MCC0659560.1 CidA/LrgA family protein [Clostridioides sp. ZZV14-6154]MCC0723781.1 CidA/LrgA family protein [Clostridioides sp. ZZV14-6104]MCC0725768.1 CidA/LrgA family protein [Clostridioides sp. ZZV14-6045]MCC0729390.1 CidA/LrgA family protein [Clostridioides sp. ZZV14-6048]MCC0733860.1 CidA/LrgA family protein [Clostridioides sp. ZZV14-6009]MCC0737810.1 CidA/LrgA family protein [Clostridioides sp. ZZV14-5902]MCC0742176.1 CidA/LrgA 